VGGSGARNLSIFHGITDTSRSPETVCVPLSRNAALTTGALCLRKTAASFLAVASQSRTVRSAPAVSTHRPPSFIATPRTGPSWPVSVTRALSSPANQTRTLPSSPPAAYHFPFGLTARLATGAGHGPCLRV